MQVVRHLKAVGQGFTPAALFVLYRFHGGTKAPPYGAKRNLKKICSHLVSLILISFILHDNAIHDVVGVGAHDDPPT